MWSREALLGVFFLLYVCKYANLKHAVETRHLRPFLRLPACPHVSSRQSLKNTTSHLVINILLFPFLKLIGSIPAFPFLFFNYELNFYCEDFVRFYSYRQQYRHKFSFTGVLQVTELGV